MAFAVAQAPSRMSPAEFRRFYDGRPEGERWELLAGVPVQVMTPPLLMHNLLAGTLARLLTDALGLHDPTRMALQGSGCELAETDDYRPEPDVAVLDADFDLGQRFIERAYLVAEIVSSTDRERVPGTREGRIEAKRRVYRLHAPCEAILAIEQDRIEVLVETRTAEGWTSQRLTGLDGALELPGFGLRCALADLYANTPLLPRRPGS